MEKVLIEEKFKNWKIQLLQDHHSNFLVQIYLENGKENMGLTQPLKTLDPKESRWNCLDWFSHLNPEKEDFSEVAKICERLIKIVAFS